MLTRRKQARKISFMKTVLITGAASGIGRGVAEKFLREKWNAVLFDISKEALEKTSAQFAALGLNNFFAFCGDCGKLDDWRLAEKFLLEKNLQLSALVNNAGIGITKFVCDLSVEEWGRVVSTNLTSIFLSAKVFGRYIKENKIPMLNIASTRALMSEPNTEAYSASKGGVVAITHALAMSLAPARVNCISPGWIDNGANSPLTAADHAQHPAGRAGVPADIASLAYFLLDNSQAGFITGQNFCCDGGMTKKMIYVE